GNPRSAPPAPGSLVRLRSPSLARSAGRLRYEARALAPRPRRVRDCMQPRLGAGERYLSSLETVCLGGFVGKRDVEVTEQVPLLGDIPILGYLFRSTSTRTEVTRIYVLLRPVVLDQEGAPTLEEHARGEREEAREELERLAPAPGVQGR
ncbi:MAG: hypothetical protein HY720_09530, partial [Planctomycetes bacterium]|nr:hypothetical protein [Planctomycetota bacterium]